MIGTVRIAAAALAACYMASLAWAEPPSATQILAASDAVRNPDQPFALTTTLTEYRSGRPADTMVLTVFSKQDGDGRYRSLVRFVDPARDRGKLVLKTGNVMWFFDPTSKASVRLSPQQRLLGQAANGDVVTVNLATDYRGRLDGEERITDAERQQRGCWKLSLDAVDGSVTYFKVEYWVDRASYQPVKGKFYSDSGRLLKIAYYRGYRPALGRERPTETLIVDGVDTDLVTRMQYSDYRLREIPEAWFQRDFLPRFTGE